MRVRDYAQATYELITAGTPAEIVLSRLKLVLEKRGHSRLYSRILHELVLREEKREKRTETVVTVGRTADISRHDLAIESALKTLGAEREYETRIDQTVIGGFKVAQYDRVVDNTYKRRLITLYRSIIG